MKTLRIMTLAAMMTFSMVSMNGQGYRPGSSSSNNNTNATISSSSNNHSSNGSNNSGYNRGNGNNNSGYNRGNGNSNNGNHYGNHNGNHGNNSGYRPYNNGAYVTPPSRHDRIDYREIYRPSYPVGYRPFQNAPCITSVFGISFGTTYSTSLDFLYSHGYRVDGYSSSTIYLRDVTEAGFNWQNGLMRYDSYGRLISTQMTYSTTFDSLARYNALYSTLSRAYGHHVMCNNNSTGWYSCDGRTYVTLEYSYSLGRFYTILTYSYN